MTTFEQILKKTPTGRRRPGALVELPLSAWAEDQPDRPHVPIGMGIRMLSELDRQGARDEALKFSTNFTAATYEDQTHIYNDALVAELVARAACQMADVTLGFFDGGAMDVRRRLTTGGVQRLFNELEALEAKADPAMPEIDEAGFSQLITLYGRGVWEKGLEPADAMYARRLLECVRRLFAEGEARAEALGMDLIEPSAELVALAGQAAQGGRGERAALEDALAAMAHRKRA